MFVRRLLRFPLILLFFGLVSAMMMIPAIHAHRNELFHTARQFFYTGLLGLFATVSVGLSISAAGLPERSDLRNLASLAASYLLLPLLLAVPFYESVATTSFLNAYTEMLSALTTTGATLFENPARLNDTLHLWRGMVGWFGGLLLWVSASAVLAPLALGGFEVTASAEPGQNALRYDQFRRASASRRLAKSVSSLAPLYAGLTLALWIALMVAGERPLTAVMHAMSTLSTSGISNLGGTDNATSGVAGEMLIFLFMLFALSRLTFSGDTRSETRRNLMEDPEFRLGMMITIVVPLLLFGRHFLAAFDVGAAGVIGGTEVTGENTISALSALWGALFTVLSFLTTTGFESADWQAARGWSGLGTPGIILMGLALIGGGVATTAGGVKLLRVYALYLNGKREMARLVHPHSIGGQGVMARRIRRHGAFVAFIFFMLMALSLTFFTMVFSALGQNFEEALVLAIAGLTTCGPLIEAAPEFPIILIEASPAAKLALGAAMIVGRLETLALIALFNPALWRD